MMVKKAGLGARLKVMTDSDYAANTYPSKVHLRRGWVKVYAMHKFLLIAVPISQ